MFPNNETKEPLIGDPSTIAEFNRYRGQFQNTAFMNFKFYQDDLLPVRLQMLLQGGRFLHHDYAEMNRMMESRENWNLFVARRAKCAVWVDTITPLLQSRNNPNVWKKLGLRSKQAVPIDPDTQAPWFLLECQIVEQYCEFVVEEASGFLWDQLPYAMTFPFVLGAMNLPNVDERKERCTFMERLCKACKKAEDKVTKNPQANRDFKIKILDKAYFLDNQLARRSMCSAFAEKFNHESVELKSYGRFLGGDPSTTADLAERAFAHLAAVSKRHAKAKSFAALTKWFYTNTNPYTHGIQMLKTTVEDYEATAGRFEAILKNKEKGFFDMNSSDSQLTLPTKHSRPYISRNKGGFEKLFEHSGIQMLFFFCSSPIQAKTHRVTEVACLCQTSNTRPGHPVL